MLTCIFLTLPVFCLHMLTNISLFPGLVCFYLYLTIHRYNLLVQVIDSSLLTMETSHTLKADGTIQLDSKDDRSIFAGFLPDCDFSRSVGRRPIFLTLNKVVNSPSGHLADFILKWPNFRWMSRRFHSAGLPAITYRSPVDLRWERMNPAIACRSPNCDR